jgi:Tol biopolymer transport system component
MPHKLRITHYVVPVTFLVLLSCSPQAPQPPHQTSLFIYRFDPPAFIEFSEDFQPVNEIPFFLPPNCGLFDTFPAPVGKFLAIELSCPGGQTVLFLDTSTSLSAGSASVTQPVADADSHFLEWMSDGKAAYLKVDSLGSPQIIRAYTDGSRDNLPINEFTYDLSARPDSRDFIFTFSRGLGYGSEMYLARQDGRVTELLYGSDADYVSFARWSPDGRQIAFITIPDTQTPFTVGGLVVTRVDKVNPRWLGVADAGHGYAANWSPDGRKIAYVVRENPEDPRADQSSDALISNIYIVEVAGGEITRLTFFKEGRAETPSWSPDGNSLTFNMVINGRMEVRIADVLSGEIRSLITESACCPAWMRR